MSHGPAPLSDRNFGWDGLPLAKLLLVGRNRDLRLFGWLLLAAACVFIAYIARMGAVTHDVFHEMALAREWLECGSFPREDCFAYTPTVSPAVHHEWGTGLLLYLAVAAIPFGLSGLMVFKLLLVAALAMLLYRVARNGGSHPLVWVILLPIVLPLLWVGFATVRAQLLTLVALAAQMLMFQSDWRGRRSWVWLWLPMYLVWLNVHAGFVVGLGMLGFHCLERSAAAWWQRRSVLKTTWHLWALLPAACLGVGCNPWGWEYVPYLLRAITMDRPTILEWKPLWHTYDPATSLFVFGVSVVMLGYAAKNRRWDRLRGWCFCVVAALMALKHIRHGSIYAVVWLAYVPAWLTPTPLGQSLIRRLTASRPRVVVGSQALAFICSCFAIWQGFWNVTIPSSLAVSAHCFPREAVAYLKGCDFRGHLMTPFHCGAYVTWELYPAVKVSLDGRYEVAFAEQVFPDHQRFYEALPGWQAILQAYEHDLILVPRDSPVARLWVDADQPPVQGWQVVYRDESFEMLARDGLELPQRQAVTTSTASRSLPADAPREIRIVAMEMN